MTASNQYSILPAVFKQQNAGCRQAAGQSLQGVHLTKEMKAHL